MKDYAEISLPWPPSVNSLHRSVVIRGRDGKSHVNVVVSALGKAFFGEVRVQKIAQHVRSFSESDRLAVEIFAFPPDQRVRDLDNILKATLDGLTRAQVWADDKQVDRICIMRRPVTKPGRVNVVITKIKES